MHRALLAVFACFLGGAVQAQQCALDLNNDHRTSINELVTAIDQALDGCPGAAVTPTRTPTPPGPPRLTNLHGAISANSALTAQCNSQGFSNAITVTADFTGDVVGGTLHAFSTLKPSGATFNQSISIPSPGVGVDAGTLEYRACLTPNSEKSLTVELQVVSPSGVSGNRLSVTFPI